MYLHLQSFQPARASRNRKGEGGDENAARRGCRDVQKKRIFRNEFGSGASEIVYFEEPLYSLM